MRDVVALEPRTRQERLDASVPPAIASRAWTLVVTRPRHRVVTPFAGDAVATVEHPPVDDDAAPHTRPEDHAEHDPRARAGAVLRFGHREAVRIVAHADLAREPRLEV